MWKESQIFHFKFSQNSNDNICKIGYLNQEEWQEIQVPLTFDDLRLRMYLNSEQKVLTSYKDLDIAGLKNVSYQFLILI